MSLRYLVGPVSARRAEEWAAHRESGRCLAFNPPGDVDLTFGPADSWETALSHLPAGWRPDFILLDLDYVTVPAALWDAPVPLVALAPDWQLQWHFLRRFLPLCQLVLTDTTGVEVMSKEGITHAVQANLFGLQGIFRQPASVIPPRRDIDILFVGNLQPAVQRHRQRWLGRLARLATNWRVLLAKGVRGEDYRQLLLRSRIVFNRSIRGEWNLRVGEACSCGALLFSEADNLEVPLAWKDGEDCVFYDEDNLESLLEHYLQHEDERQSIAAAGQDKIRRFTFAGMWEHALARIEENWAEIQARHAARPRLSAAEALSSRTWQALCAADAGDAGLAAELDSALAAQSDPTLHNCRGLLESLQQRDAKERGSPERMRRIAGHFHRSAALPGSGPLAALNLIEVLIALGQKQLAIEGARRLLTTLLDEPPSLHQLQLPHFPPGYDFFRVEWENAAWQNAGRAAKEIQAKLALLRWRLHSLLATLTGELLHHHEAVLARPDLPATRAALGCALGEAKRPMEAVPHLRFAVEADPFDRAAARALFQAMIDAGKPAQAEAFKEERRLLHKAAPTAVPADEWMRIARRGEGRTDLQSVLFCCRTDLQSVPPDDRRAESRTDLQSVPPHDRATPRPDHYTMRGDMPPDGLQIRPTRRENGLQIRPTGIVSADQPIIAGTRRVSLCIIVKNEEHNLPACLDSAADLCDEVIVVDTGSTDRTREIARERGAKLFDFPWIDSFSAARNACLEHATGEWIFWLDADDRIDEQNRDKLRRLFASLPAENVAYSMKCRCLPDPVTGTATTVDHIRLFINHPRIRWRYRVHEQILGAVREAGGDIHWAEVVIQHTGYVDPPLRQRKLQRDLRLLEIQQREQPHEPFTLFNLGATYAEMGRPDEAIPLLQESLDRSHPRDSIVRKLYALIAGCHLNRRRLPAALQVCIQGQAVCPDDEELLFLEGAIRTDQGDLDGARAALVRLLGTTSGQHFASIADGLRTFKGRHQLAVVCCRLGETSEAELLWQAVLRERPEFLPAYAGLGDMYLSLQRWPDLQEQVDALSRSPKGEIDAVLLRARAHMERQEYTAARSILTESLTRHSNLLVLRLTLSHALLQENSDHAEAERVLGEILARDPANAQARQNLEVLRRRFRPSDGSA